MSGDQSKQENCKACGGTGNEVRARPITVGKKIEFRPCPECDGTGKPLQQLQKLRARN